MQGAGYSARFWISGGAGRVLDPAMSDSIADLTARIRSFVPGQIEKRAVEKREEIASEIADVAILLFEMADLLGMKLGDVMEAKIERNEIRYPAEKSRGNNLKYNEL
jgi:dCTP diphosphatase